MDDRSSNVHLLERMLAHEGFVNVTSTTDSARVAGLFAQGPPDLLLLDLQMPAPDGFEVMRLIRRWSHGPAGVPILVLTGDTSAKTRIRALEAGARDFLTKPFDLVEVTLRIRNLLETRRLHQDLQAANDSLEERVKARTEEVERARTEAFGRLGVAAEYRDDDTRQHTQRVGITSALLAAEAGFDPPLVDALATIAPLHDVGKIGIPDAVLLKAGALDHEEFVLTQTHTVIGSNLLGGTGSPALDAAAVIALTHHEHWDGSGYPAGLEGPAIPITGRIVALADAFDAMTHARPYRDALPVADAVAEIGRGSGRQFDPELVAAFECLDPEVLASPPLADRFPPPPTSAWLDIRELSHVEGAEAQHA